MSKLFPPWKFYRSLVVQGVAVFVAGLCYSGQHVNKPLWGLGGYILGLFAMTVAWHSNNMERKINASLPRCPTCGRPQ